MPVRAVLMRTQRYFAPIKSSRRRIINKWKLLMMRETMFNIRVSEVSSLKHRNLSLPPGTEPLALEVFCATSNIWRLITSKG